jgi:hypothetical protein
MTVGGGDDHEGQAAGQSRQTTRHRGLPSPVAEETTHCKHSSARSRTGISASAAARANPAAIRPAWEWPDLLPAWHFLQRSSAAIRGMIAHGRHEAAITGIRRRRNPRRPVRAENLPEKQDLPGSALRPERGDGWQCRGKRPWCAAAGSGRIERLEAEGPDWRIRGEREVAGNDKRGRSSFRNATSLTPRSPPTAGSSPASWRSQKGTQLFSVTIKTPGVSRGIEDGNGKELRPLFTASPHHSARRAASRCGCSKASA